MKTVSRMAISRSSKLVVAEPVVVGSDFKIGIGGIRKDKKAKMREANTMIAMRTKIDGQNKSSIGHLAYRIQPRN